MSKKIPNFKNTEEERTFWDTTDTTELIESGELVPVEDVKFIRPLKTITIRVPEDSLRTLKVVAKKKGIGYSTLIRMWIGEKLEEEKKASGG